MSWLERWRRRRSPEEKRRRRELRREAWQETIDERAGRDSITGFYTGALGARPPDEPERSIPDEP
jgi:hypothetical protein